MKFPFSSQLGARDCGPACLKMMAEYFGQTYAIDFLRDHCHITKVGVSLLGISEAAETIGFQSTGVKMDLEQLKEIVRQVPIILHWNENHFVVVYKAPKSKKRKGSYHVADPALGLMTYDEKEFVERWMGKHAAKQYEFENYSKENTSEHVGYALILEPNPAFYDEPKKEGLQKKADFRLLWKYFLEHKKYFFRLLICMLITNAALLVMPYFTQALVDKGINSHDLNIVYMILLGQLLLFVVSSVADIIRSYLLLKMGTLINISMVSDFFKKMLNLPVSFFESHIAGDLMQRIHDHQRIEKLLTVSSLNTVFSILNFFVLSVVLAIYNFPIFLLFLIGSGLGFGWTLLFLLKRRKVDFRMFELYSRENNKVMEIINGVQDIKISNSMEQKRSEWKNIQSSLFTMKTKSLNILQWQNTGSSIFKQCTFILITFLAAKNVIEGNITIGTMFAINMIVGLLSSPLDHLLELVTSMQDAKIGLERITDVTTQKDEDSEEHETTKVIPDKEDIILQNVTFNYGSEQLEPVLKNISLVIPSGKVTAIVGASGSGKTTLMKLLLRFYDPQHGEILLNNINFKNLHHGKWREKCGVVMQNGQLFSGTIASNISMGWDSNYEAMIRAAHIARLDEFIPQLSMGFETEVGSEGIPLSTGQTQRILIARAVYKNPSYIFLDEATSALDAGNEKTVIEKLDHFFKGRTVVVVAHRLSTVKNADQLIVLERGEIVEIGSHIELTKKKGIYYTLVKNQLELGD